MANDSMCSWCKTVIKAGEGKFTDGDGCDYHLDCMPAVYNYLNGNGSDALCEVLDGPAIGARGEARVLRKSTPKAKAKRVETT